MNLLFTQHGYATNAYVCMYPCAYTHSRPITGQASITKYALAIRWWLCLLVPASEPYRLFDFDSHWIPRQSASCKPLNNHKTLWLRICVHEYLWRVLAHKLEACVCVCAGNSELRQRALERQHYFHQLLNCWKIQPTDRHTYEIRWVWSAYYNCSRAA